MCSMCQDLPEYKKYLIKKYKYWRVELYSNQSYLGRCVIILNRHLEDFFDITHDELNELYAITKKLRDAIKSSFHPDLFNYASLGNDTRHVHLHVVPRYSRIVTFHGHKFEDKKWGYNYSGYDKTFKLSDDLIHIIIREIQI